MTKNDVILPVTCSKKTFTVYTNNGCNCKLHISVRFGWMQLSYSRPSQSSKALLLQEIQGRLFERIPDTGVLRCFLIWMRRQE